MSDVTQWFAVWHVSSNTAIALDVYPDEIESYRDEFSQSREGFSGPYDTRREALLIAMTSCREARRKTPRVRLKGMTVYGCQEDDQDVVGEWLRENGHC